MKWLYSPIVLAILASASVQAADYNFVLIEDTDGDFSSLGWASINDSGYVGFLADLDAGGEGIFTSDGRTLTQIAGTGYDPVINNSGVVAFSRNGDVFSGNGITEVTIASDGSMPSINNNGIVSFTRRYGIDAGIFKGDGLAPIPIVDTSGDFPLFQEENYPYFGQSDINDQGLVAFEALPLSLNPAPYGYGIFTGNGGAITEILGSDYAVSKNIGGINNSGSISVRRFATHADYTAIDIYSDGDSEHIASGFWVDIPGSPFFFLHEAAINDAGAVAFLAQHHDGTYCVMSGPDPANDRVICEGDALGGSTVDWLWMEREFINNYGDIVFEAGLADGRQAIFVAKAPASVTVTIKPGTDSPDVKVDGGGVLPVAALTTDSFDATQIDTTTLRFGPGAASITHSHGHVADIDNDGDSDLVVHFKNREIECVCGDTEATLSGRTFDGRNVSGTVSINTVGKSCS